MAGGRYLHSRGAAGTSGGLSKRAEKEQRRCMPIRKEERKEKEIQSVQCAEPRRS